MSAWVKRMKKVQEIIDQIAKADITECVINTMSGPPPEVIHDRTQRTHIQSQDRV